MSHPAIQVINVTKQFGSNLAASNINLQIEEGEFFSFLGPSGCGKTTLLRMIAGFETPTAGQILINGLDVVGVPPHKRPVNMVFQNYALFPHLTVGDNVAFGLKSAGKFSKTEIADKVKESLELVRLTQLIDRLPSQLSGGQQQRVALARAVVNNPAVLLLDEPLSALDPQIREEMQVELARLQKRINMTFIMVTHDQNEALALSNRVAVFCQGNLEQVGAPEEIYENPKTLFVAKFIGQTNLLPGQVTESSNDKYKIEVCNGLQITVAENGHSLPSLTPVTVWMKPHAIVLFDGGTQPADAADNVIAAVISNRSYQGTTTEYLVRLQDGTELRVSCTNDGLKKTRARNVGETVQLLIPYRSCALLHEQTVESALTPAGI